MAAPRLMLAFAVAAFLPPLARICQESEIFLFPYSENPQVPGNISGAKGVHQAACKIFSESGKAIILFREPSAWYAY